MLRVGTEGGGGDRRCRGWERSEEKKTRREEEREVGRGEMMLRG